jgi:Na+-translocating ferredoxin:NAD+ oxidoreductase subunit D
LSDREQRINAQPVLSEKEKLEIKNTRKYMIDMLMVLVAPMAMSFYYYGLRAVLLVLYSVVTALVCELLASRIYKFEACFSDLSSMVTAITVAMCIPASSPWWVPILTTVFALAVVKFPFGNSRSLMFLPSAAGIAFLTVCNSARMFAYPIIPTQSDKFAVLSSENAAQGNSIAYMLSQGNSIGINIISYIDIAVGNVSGPMGATCALAIFAGLLYLLIRRPKTAVMSFVYLGTCAVYAFLFPRITTGRGISVIMELCSGLVGFAALMFVTNETLAPKRTNARILYAALMGLMTMLLRTFGSFEDSTVFAVLIANSFAAALDKKLPLTKKEKLLIEQKKAAEAMSVDRPIDTEEQSQIVAQKVMDIINSSEDSQASAEKENGGASDV